MNTLCRDCLALQASTSGPSRCAICGSRRLVVHEELTSLGIAHIDCDAFYASIEKRDDPSLRDRPVIVGGGRRGVVAAACYVARLYGIHSAMPMFKALAACPDAVVLRPDMEKYRREGQKIRAMMTALTPLVEPLSIDEAFLDLTGTDRLHGGPPAQTLARLALRIEEELGLAISIGLSHNKFLAKIASDLDKPRGFACIGRAETMTFLADKPVGLLWGVGRAMQRKLEGDGIRRVGDLLRYEEAVLMARYGAIGQRLYRFARGQDDRRVDPAAPTKSISAETTFERDHSEVQVLLAELWPLCETVSRRLKRQGLAARGVVLKLKTSEFRLLSRSRRLAAPTVLAEQLYAAGGELLRREVDGRRFRLIGIGTADLVDIRLADPPDLLDPERSRRMQAERALDAVRAKLGEDAIRLGRSLAREAQQPGSGSASSSTNRPRKAKSP